MTTTLKVGLLGAGVFAGYYAGKIGAHPRCRLAGVFDTNPARADALAGAHGAAATGDRTSLIHASDAVVIALPASRHREAGLAVLAAGRPALIEKPLSDTLDGARALAAAGGLVQVGHQERIVAQAIGLHRIPQRPSEISIVRSSGRTTRNLDTSVIMDLMIHDLDLLLALFGPASWTSLEQGRSIYSDHLDAARAEIGFGDMTAYVSASRDAAPERRWTLRYPSGTVEIDFGAKRLRHDTPFDLDPSFADRPDVADSLGTAFDRFVRACLDGEPVLASAQDGLEAVALASALSEGLADDA